MKNDFRDICHSSIPGMKWGNRRYQHEDGTLTPEGRLRYRKGTGQRSTSNSTKTTGKRGLSTKQKVAVGVGVAAVAAAGIYTYSAYKRGTLEVNNIIGKAAERYGTDQWYKAFSSGQNSNDVKTNAVDDFLAANKHSVSPAKATMMQMKTDYRTVMQNGQNFLAKTLNPVISKNNKLAVHSNVIPLINYINTSNKPTSAFNVKDYLKQPKVRFGA